MSEISFDYDVVAPLPPLMASAADALRRASTVPSPDAGVSTDTTRAAIDATVRAVAGLADDLDRLADGVAQSAALYARGDGEVSGFLEMLTSSASR